MKQSAKKINPEEILKHIDPARLKKFIIDYGANHPEFLEKFMTSFSPQKVSAAREDYVATIKKAFGDNAIKSRGRFHRYNDVGFDAFSVRHNLQPLVDKVAYFVKHKNYDEAVLLCRTLIETIPDNWESHFDEEGDVQVIYDSAIDKLQEMLEQQLLSAAQKKALFNWYTEEFEDEKHTDVGLNTNLKALQEFFTGTPEMLQQIIKNIDERIANTTEGYVRERAVLDKIKLLQNAGMDNEVEKVITKYLVFEDVRELRIQKLVQKKQYEEAVALINDGIKIAIGKKQTGTVTGWKDNLLDIYLLQKDKAKIYSAAEELFYDGNDPVKYYRVLKKHTDKEKWAEYLDTLLLPQKKRGSLKHPNYVLAEIYIEEEYWDRLLHIVQKSEISGFQEYEKHLKARYPEEMRDLLVQKITEYADRNMGLHYYEFVARTLKKIRTYPGGKEVVDKLLAEFRMKYKLRKAMMQELKGV